MRTRQNRISNKGTIWVKQCIENGIPFVFNDSFRDCSVLSVRCSEAWLVYHCYLSSGFYNRYTMDWAAYTINIDFSQFWRLGSLRLRCQQIQCVVRTCFLVSRWAPSRFLLTWWWVEWEEARSLMPFLIRTLISYMRALLYDLTTSQRPQLEIRHIED